MSWAAEIDEHLDTDLRQKVGRAEAVWRKLGGDAADRVDVNWRLERIVDPPGGHPVLWMSVKDPEDNITLPDQKFTPEELENDLHMHNRMYSIWSDLFRRGSQTHLRRVQEILNSFSGD